MAYKSFKREVLNNHGIAKEKGLWMIAKDFERELRTKGKYIPWLTGSLTVHTTVTLKSGKIVAVSSTPYAAKQYYTHRSKNNWFKRCYNANQQRYEEMLGSSLSGRKQRSDYGTSKK